MEQQPVPLRTSDRARPRWPWLPDVLTAAAIVAMVALALLAAACEGSGLR